MWDPQDDSGTCAKVIASKVLWGWTEAGGSWVDFIGFTQWKWFKNVSTMHWVVLHCILPQQIEDKATHLVQWMLVLAKKYCPRPFFQHLPCYTFMVVIFNFLFAYWSETHTFSSIIVSSHCTKTFHKIFFSHKNIWWMVCSFLVVNVFVFVNKKTIWPQLSTLKVLQWRNPMPLMQPHTLFQYFENLLCSDREREFFLCQCTSSKQRLPRIPIKIPKAWPAMYQNGKFSEYNSMQIHWFPVFRF